MQMLAEPSVTFHAVIVAKPESVLPAWFWIPLSIICLGVVVFAFWMERRN